MEYQIIYIRQENINNEFRTPLIPLDVKILVDFGFTVLFKVVLIEFIKMKNIRKMVG